MTQIQTNILIVVAVWLICAVGSFLIALQRGDPYPVIGLLFGPLGLLLT